MTITSVHHARREEPEERVGVEARADGGGQRDREEQQRQRHHDLGQPRHQRVQRAAVEAGDHAQEDAQRRARRSSRVWRPRATPGRPPASAGTRRGRLGRMYPGHRGRMVVGGGETRGNGQTGWKFLTAFTLIRSYGSGSGCARRAAADEGEQEHQHNGDRAGDGDTVCRKPAPRLLPVAHGRRPSDWTSRTGAAPASVSVWLVAILGSVQGTASYRSGRAHAIRRDRRVPAPRSPVTDRP